jgi:hypothetical protein
MEQIQADIMEILNIVENRFGELDTLLVELQACVEKISAYHNSGIGTYTEIIDETKKVMNLVIESPVGGMVSVFENMMTR